MEAMTKITMSGEKKKKALSRQSSLMNNENEGKAYDYVNWEARVTALKTDSNRSV